MKKFVPILTTPETVNNFDPQNPWVAVCQIEEGAGVMMTVLGKYRTREDADRACHRFRKYEAKADKLNAPKAGLG